MIKNLLVAVAAVLISACAATVPMTIKSTPPGVTKQQIQLDDLECSNASRTNGPWMYGIGTAIIRSEAAKRFAQCMSAKGYVVERGSGDAGSPSSTAPQSPLPDAAQTDAASQAFERLHPTTPTQAQDAVTKEAPAASRAMNPGAPGSPDRRLEELEKLYKAGLITKDEYERKRQEILATL